MLRWALQFAALTALFPLCSQAPSNQETAPSVVVSLPPDLPSESVDIRYFLAGPFGGHGGFIKPQADRHSYELASSVDGVAAKSIRIVVYASGCKFQTYNFDLAQPGNVEAHFVCEVLPKVVLSGQIVGAPPLNDDAELRVHYLGFWVKDFFGIADGFVPEFPIATATPDANGRFYLEIPDFYHGLPASSLQRNASLELELRDRRTLNPILHDLRPQLPELRSRFGGLQIQSNYPSDLVFVAARR